MLVIACGALAREINQLRKLNGWRQMDLYCLPAELHNTPRLITDAVREVIDARRADVASIFVAYGDCGTGGGLDAMLAEAGVERIPGAHCYEFFAGSDTFAALADEEPGSLYLTDFLARHFDRLVIRGLGIDRHPELEAQYFGHYRRLVYLAQVGAPQQLAAARAAAVRLGLEFELRVTGYGGLERSLRGAVVSVPMRAPAWPS